MVNALSRENLVQGFADALREIDKSDRPLDNLIRVEIECDSCDPIEWLRSQRSPEKFYWCDRARGFECSGVGSADCVMVENQSEINRALQEIRRKIVAARGNIRYYGGIAFPGALDKEWSGFGHLRFVAPQMELRRQGDSFRVSVTLRDAGDLTAILPGDRAPTEPPGHRAQPPRLSVRRDTPDRSQWGSLFARAGASIRSGEIEKIVLARRTLLEFENSPDPFFMLDSLRLSSVNCHVFAFAPQGAGVFLGASPERLFSRRDRAIKVDAIAGTTAVGATGSAGDRLGEQMRTTPKEMHEHALVVDYIRARLAPVTTSLTFDSAPSVLRLSSAQHLYSRFRGTLKDDKGDETIVSLLHPTPATGGVPRDTALMTLAQIEPFSRGWYAGAVGWIGEESSELIVALRSGLLDGSRFFLYGGAGIVEGSLEQNEWDEIERKISPLLLVSGCKNHINLTDNI